MAKGNKVLGGEEGEGGGQRRRPGAGRGRGARPASCPSPGHLAQVHARASIVQSDTRYKPIITSPNYMHPMARHEGRYSATPRRQTDTLF